MRRQSSFGFPTITIGVKRLLLAIAAIFVLQIAVVLMMSFEDHYLLIVRGFGLDAQAVVRGKIWQPATYMWLHSVDGWAHILFNSLTLYFFGSELEQKLGTKRFIRDYLIAGIAVGILVTFWAFFRASIAEEYVSVPVIGASGAISAVIAGFCYFSWEKTLHIFIKLKGKHLLAIVIAIDLLQAIRPASSSSLSAHLFGILWGLLWYSGRLNPRQLWLKFSLWRIRRKMSIISGGKDDRTYWN